jgi:hypothetical protein
MSRGHRSRGGTNIHFIHVGPLRETEVSPPPVKRGEKQHDHHIEQCFCYHWLFELYKVRHYGSVTVYKQRSSLPTSRGKETEAL